MATPNTDPLTCKELVELVTDYLEDTLAASERQRVDEHLATCPYCQIYMDQMRQTIRTLGHLPQEAVPPEALEALLARFRGWR